MKRVLFICVVAVVAAGAPASETLPEPDYTRVTGYVPNAGLPAKQPVVLWKFTNEFGLTDITTADGIVYFGTHDGQVIALKAADGSVAWKHSIPGRDEALKRTKEDALKSNGPRYVLSDYFRVGKPAVDKECVYFGMPTGVTAIRRDDGKFVWHRDFKYGVLESMPLPIGHRVYVSAYDGKAYSLHRPTGRVVWEHDLVEDAPSDPAGFAGKNARGLKPARPTGAACDGKIFVQCVFDQSRVVAIDCVSGEKRWSFQMGGYTAAAPTIVNDRVYIGSQDGKLYCLSRDSGTVMWSSAAPTWIASRVAVHAGKVYLTCHRGKLFQLDAQTGRVMLAFTVQEDRNSATYCFPIVDEHTVYFATGSGQLYAVGIETGQLAWKIRPSPHSELFTDPATDGRRIFVTSRPIIKKTGENAIIAVGNAE
jgi:outer membrane protein assembly factor BamB